MRNQDEFTRAWIIENAISEIANYEDGVLTLRGLHYRLVARGMTNTLQHYKRVVAAITAARWDGAVRFEVFSDHDREMLGITPFEVTNVDDQIETGKMQIKAWMNHYSKNRWENQEVYPEIMIEKKALIGTFQPVSRRHQVTMGACKGYPSLTFLNEAKDRIQAAQYEGKRVIILYFGDYDPSGEDIPRSIGENLEKLGCPGVEVRRIALMEDQVVKWELPPAPAKLTDSRTANWNGLGQVELDAVEPNQLQDLVTDAINDIFDNDKYEQLKETENEEKKVYQTALKAYVKTL